MLNNNSELEPSELETHDGPLDVPTPDWPQLSELDLDVCVEPLHLPESGSRGQGAKGDD